MEMDAIESFEKNFCSCLSWSFHCHLRRKSSFFCCEVSVWASWTKNIFARTESFRDTDIEKCTHVHVPIMTSTHASVRCSI